MIAAGGRPRRATRSVHGRPLGTGLVRHGPAVHDIGRSVLARRVRPEPSAIHDVDGASAGEGQARSVGCPVHVRRLERRQSPDVGSVGIHDEEALRRDEADPGPIRRPRRRRHTGAPKREARGGAVRAHDHELGHKARPCSGVHRTAAIRTPSGGHAGSSNIGTSALRAGRTPHGTLTGRSGPAPRRGSRRHPPFRARRPGRAPPRRMRSARRPATMPARPCRSSRGARRPCSDARRSHRPTSIWRARVEGDPAAGRRPLDVHRPSRRASAAWAAMSRWRRRRRGSGAGRPVPTAYRDRPPARPSGDHASTRC